VRSIVACMTALFLLGFLGGGARDAHPDGEEAVEVGVVERPGPDLRVGFRRLSAPPTGVVAGIRGCRPGLSAATQ